uniref:Secreted protein n=1 Tax=Aegilops tauschii subsp. strangulata TaxID=200361 RepID=A0A453I9Z5_AEGTS
MIGAMVEVVLLVIGGDWCELLCCCWQGQAILHTQVGDAGPLVQKPRRLSQTTPRLAHQAFFLRGFIFQGWMAHPSVDAGRKKTTTSSNTT